MGIDIFARVLVSIVAFQFTVTSADGNAAMIASITGGEAENQFTSLSISEDDSSQVMTAETQAE